MESVESILNHVGRFSCYISNQQVSFSGVLSRASDGIVLQCKLKIELYRKIGDYSALQVWGKVNGIHVTLLDVYLQSGTCKATGTYISLIFSPSQIVIGKSSATELKTVQMSMSLPALNYMFSSSLLQSVQYANTENQVPIDPVVLEAEDDYGHLKIYQTMKEEWNRNKVCYTAFPIIEYQFSQPLNLMDALSKLATVKNLFTFFANYYLPLENISFVSEIARNSKCPSESECILYLNYGDDILPAEEPFLITTSSFSGIFQKVWERWLCLYEEAVYIPTLFYEIICNRSTRVNRFLNLSQALEVYSNRYRKENVKEIAMMREKTKPGKEPPVHLNHKYEDIFSLLNPILEIESSKIHSISNTLADMRNFFTHYDDEKFLEPSYQEMLAACHVLEFILLAIIYHDVGIPDVHIRASRKRSQFQRFDEFVEILTNLRLHRKESTAPPIV